MIDTTDRAGDVARLAALKAESDPRTIEQMVADDHFDEVTVERVEHGTDGWNYITWDSGTSCGVRGDASPEVGDKVRLYGSSSLGGSHHGWALNGKLVQWKTPWERFAERIQWLADYDRRQREEFAARKAELDAKYETLPSPLKARIDRFRAEEADFRVTSEAYEMAAVGDAPKIARALAEQHGWMVDDDLRVVPLDDESDEARADREGVIQAATKAFYDLPYEEQKRLVPDLDEGHSGNTFGAAVGLAGRVLAGLDV